MNSRFEFVNTKDGGWTKSRLGLVKNKDGVLMNSRFEFVDTKHGGWTNSRLGFMKNKDGV